MKFELYQITNPATVKYAFGSFRKDLFSMKDYGKPVYVGKVRRYEDEDAEETLENLFRIFNVDFPKDYYGRSLSVSDVVRLDDRYFYCGLVGWREITDSVEKIA